MIKEGNFITIQSFMVTKLNLKGNDLLIYAIIFGFSQTEGQQFTGSLQYLADWTNSTVRGVQKNLKSLIEKGLIEKEEVYNNGVKFCKYSAKMFDSIEQSSNEVWNKVPEGMEQSSNNNIYNNINNNIYIEIFNKWNEQNVIKHKELKEVHKRAIDKALKTYTKEEILLAIEHYGKIIHSNFYFNYKWSLTDFLNRKNGMSTFTNEGTNYINYLNWLDNPPKGYRAVNQGNIKSNYSILYDDDDNYFDN